MLTLGERMGKGYSAYGWAFRRHLSWLWEKDAAEKMSRLSICSSQQRNSEFSENQHCYEDAQKVIGTIMLFSPLSLIATLAKFINFLLQCLQRNDEKRKEEQRKYGVFFDDDYNYLQYLKEASGPSELVPSSFPNEGRIVVSTEGEVEDEIQHIPVSKNVLGCCCGGISYNYHYVCSNQASSPS